MTQPTDQSSREQALSPCPFCGIVGLDFSEGSTFRWLNYSCAGCGVGAEVRVQTLGDGTKEEWLTNARAEAIKEWNTRSPIPPTAITAEEAGREGEAKDAAPHWATCESRGPMIRNSLTNRITEMRDAEKRARTAFRQPFMSESTAWYADALGEAAAVLERRLATLLPPAPAQSGGES